MKTTPKKLADELAKRLRDEHKDDAEAYYTALEDALNALALHLPPEEAENAADEEDEDSEGDDEDSDEGDGEEEEEEGEDE